MKNILLSTLVAISLSSYTFGNAINEENINISEIETPKTNFYFGLGYSSFTVEIDRDITYDALNILLGYKFHQYLSTEFRYIYGKNSDFTATNKAFYLKPQYLINDKFEIYALLGYGEVVARQSSDSGFQWGVGAEYFVNEAISISADYITHYDDTLEAIDNHSGNNYESTLSSINLSVNYYF